MIWLAKVRPSAQRVSPAGRQAPIAVWVLLRSRSSADARRPDHVRCQELRNERDEIDSHGASSRLHVADRATGQWGQPFTRRMGEQGSPRFLSPFATFLLAGKAAGFAYLFWPSLAQGHPTVCAILITPSLILQASRCRRGISGRQLLSTKIAPRRCCVRRPPLDRAKPPIRLL